MTDTARGFPLPSSLAVPPGTQGALAACIALGASNTRVHSQPTNQGVRRRHRHHQA